MSGFAESLKDWQLGVACPWPSLTSKVAIRPGGVTILAGAPGALKSMLMLNWLMEIDQPTLYLSFDTSKQMQAVRIISRVTGRPSHEVYAEIDDEGQRRAWIDWLEGWDQTSKMKCLTIPTTAEEVGAVVNAWREFWGDAPVLTVVDDISKMRGVRDYQDYDGAIIELGRVAKRTNTVVIGIQHLNRSNESATKPVRLRQMKYAGEYEAAYVLGLWRPTPDTLRISVLKNRTGEDDPEGRMYAQLHADPARTLVREQNVLEAMRPTT